MPGGWPCWWEGTPRHCCSLQPLAAPTMGSRSTQAPCCLSHGPSWQVPKQDIVPAHAAPHLSGLFQQHAAGGEATCDGALVCVHQGGLAPGPSWAALGQGLEAAGWGQPPWQPSKHGPWACL